MTEWLALMDDGRAVRGRQLTERHVFLGRGIASKGTKLLRRRGRHMRRWQGVKMPEPWHSAACANAADKDVAPALLWLPERRTRAPVLQWLSKTTDISVNAQRGHDSPRAFTERLEHLSLRRAEASAARTERFTSHDRALAAEGRTARADEGVKAF